MNNQATRASQDLSRMMRAGRSFSGNERNCCFLNMGAAPAAAGRFANISAVSGLDYPDDGRAVALVDWDHDGDLDMWISNRNAPRLRLMRNELPRGNHFLALRLEGNGKTTNRDAIGARVEVESSNPKPENGNPKSIKTLRAGEGFLAQSSKWLHFGLGAADVVDKVIVHWPGGEVEQFTGLDVDRRYRLIQGSGKARDITSLARKTKLVPSAQKVAAPILVARIPLLELLTAPSSPYRDFNGRQHDLPTGKGHLLLVNLWASWCGPCLVELKEFSDRYEEIQAAGIDILALSIDGLGEDASAQLNAANLAADREFPFPVGEASSRLIADYRDLHNLLIPLQQGGQLPLPSSFLIDRQGRLSVIYKGPVSIDELLKDVTHSEGNRLERFARSAPIAGQPIRHAQVERTAAVSAGFYRFLLANQLQQSGRAGEAARQYVDVLEFWPDSFWAHNNLGGALRALGRNDEAIAHFREALRIEPDHAMAHRNLGAALQGQGKTVEAMEHYRQALRIEPDDAKTHNKLATTLQNHGRIAEAIEQYQQVLRIKPDDAQAHTNLGIALNLHGNSKEAIDHFRQALRIDPDDAQAHTSLGIALGVQGDFPAAIRQYTRALDLNPDIPLALNSLARIRATHPDAKLRDGAEAVRLAERCCKLSGYRVATALNTLAAAYAEAGRFDDAIKWQTKAIELAPAARKADLRARLKLYRAGKPYRDRPGDN